MNDHVNNHFVTGGPIFVPRQRSLFERLTDAAALLIAMSVTALVVVAICWVIAWLGTHLPTS